MKINMRFIWLAILLIMGFLVGWRIFEENDTFVAITFFIAYTGLVFSLMKEYHYASEGAKRRKTKIVASQNPVLLQMKLNEQLYSLKKETIVNIQMVDSRTAIIIYTE